MKGLSWFGGNYTFASFWTRIWTRFAIRFPIIEGLLPGCVVSLSAIVRSIKYVHNCVSQSPYDVEAI